VNHSKSELYHTIEHLQRRLSTALDKELCLLERLIELQDAAEQPHLNKADHLPPVNCPLLISVDGRLVRASRTGYVAKKADGMEYETPDGTKLYGRYRWTYP